MNFCTEKQKNVAKSSDCQCVKSYEFRKSRIIAAFLKTLHYDLTLTLATLLWWTRRESNPCPKSDSREYLRVQFVYNIPAAAGRQTGRRIGSFMRSWPPAKLEAAHVQRLNDALAPHDA